MIHSSIFQMIVKFPFCGIDACAVVRAENKYEQWAPEKKKFMQETYRYNYGDTILNSFNSEVL